MRTFFFHLLLILSWLSEACAVLAAPPVLLPLPSGAPLSSQSTPAAPKLDQVDFGPYVAVVQKRVKARWRAPDVSTAQQTVASFSIKPNGEVFNLTVKESSGDATVDERALATIRKAAPFEPLPTAYRGPRIDLQMTFDNVNSRAAKLNRSAFPLKVWVNSYFRSTEQLVPADILAALRQGVLDWTRLLLETPENDSIQNFIFILQKLPEEKQELELLEAGVFAFVTEVEQADLKIEVIPESRVLNREASGFFVGTEGRIGRIEIAAYGGRDETREFYLRTVLMHEIGHALGLDHMVGQKCNFMSPDLYTCFTDQPRACRPDVRDTRCISVHLDQMRPIERLLLAETSKDTPRKASVLAEAIADATDTTSVARQPTDTAAQIPVIDQFEFSPADRPLHRGDILRVSLAGTPGAKVTFRIVSYPAESLLREVKPGRYEGQVQIGSGVNIKDGTVQVLLMNEQGRVLQNSDRKITIQSLP